MSYVETSSLKNSTIMLLYSERDEINVSPEYQRMGGVWTLEKRRLLINSILNDYDLPKIYFHSLGADDSTQFRYAVIDGRQRLETIWGFIDGEFTLSSDFEYQRDSTINLAGLGYQDIAKQYPKIKVKFDSFVLPVITVVIEGEDIDLIEDMFSRLNEAVPLNAAEKRNAIGGDLVREISRLSEHQFFTVNVRFRNNRFQYRESVARFLLLEDSLRRDVPIVDTKKVYLDALARRYHDGNRHVVVDLSNRVQAVLDLMSNIFVPSDELLAGQGILVVYYLTFKAALEYGNLPNITRRRLIDFRDVLRSNRENAVNAYETASFEYLEFDRLNQQGTNDASSIKERCRIIGNFLNLNVYPEALNA